VRKIAMGYEFATGYEAASFGRDMSARFHTVVSDCSLVVILQCNVTDLRFPAIGVSVPPPRRRSGGAIPAHVCDICCSYPTGLTSLAVPQARNRPGQHARTLASTDPEPFRMAR
jgi:hypothetical protein